MEEKRRDAGAQPAANADSSPSSEPASSRRRAGAQKRKASNLSASGSSSAPSKRMTREKTSLSHNPPIHNHNGPLTRARQGPNSLASASVAGAAAAAASKPAAAQAKRSEQSAGEAVAELMKRESELEALEASMEADFETIRSCGVNAHVVPSHCGWFSWTKIHPIEERMLPSFFNGKSDTRTPDTYLEIRNCIMKRFHTNPGTLIELKDLLELEVGEFDARQEVMEFLDHWGLINFHPFQPTDSAVASADSDEVALKDSLVDKLYHFEALESRSSVVPKTNLTTTTPTVPSGLFPESAIAEELVRPEGPAVEYHCNSCSADCSRKRYHCQKQADYDLCTDCFNNGKLDSGMSPSDFILMEPAEAPGVSGGKWTDQETLLLLEALELYKENWNEIAEHVATKTKAQCILHFVQMPIEDTFLDYDDLDASAKETADPTSTDPKTCPNDAPETTENKTGANESDPQTSTMETSKEEVTEVKVGQDTSKPEDVNEVKVGQETSKLEYTSELKVDQETDENIALKALKEAFEVVGYSPTPEGQLSFAEVGNPVMALAAFLARLVGPDVAIASAHNSLKSISANSPGIELAARHCFLLEDPPNDSKEQAGPDSVASEMVAQKDKVHEDKNQKDDNSTSGLEEKDLSNENSDKKLEKFPPEEKSQSATEQDDIVSHEEVGADNLDKTNNLELAKDQPPTTVGESDDSKVEAEHPPSSVKESQEGISAGKSSDPSEIPKDVDMSDSLPSTKNEPQQPETSNSVEEPPRSTEVSKDVDVSNSLVSENNEPPQPVTTKSEEPPQPTEIPKDVDMVCDSQTPQKNEPPQPVTSNSMVEDGATEDKTKDGKREKHDGTEIKADQKIDKIKHAAVSAVSAAAVKAKLLAEQEEDQIRQLTVMLIEKQLHKLEAKLTFFSEMESVVMKVREQLDRSRQKLYHERAQIIATRLGLQGSSSRAMPTNRIAMNTNSAPRPPLSMGSQRPPISRPMGQMAPTPPNQFSSTTLAGSSIRPPSQDNLSSVGTK